MKHFLLFAALAFFAACNAQDAGKSMVKEVPPPPRLLEQVYVSDTSIYARKAAAAFEMLSDSQRVAQMIMTTGGRLGKSQKDIAELIREGVVGGSIYLANELEDHRNQVAESRAVGAQYAPVPLWFAIDAEPSLMYRRIVGGPDVMPAADMKNDTHVVDAVNTIDSLIADLGYNWNYAPVLDLGTENAAIKNRSFGFDAATVAERSIMYVNETQADGILACVKHFPGHGLVQGDSHKGSVFIDGEMTEYGVYEQVLAEADPLSLMVGHITIKNNAYDTEGLPASLSRRVTHDLVREKLGYEGIVVTDAINMMAAASKYGEQAPLMASKAGADVILMPVDERLTMRMILDEMAKDPAYKAQVYRSVDRVLRAKAWLGLI
jgi:beta-N-acetylhexosaminidase